MSATVSGGQSPYTYVWTDVSDRILGCDSELIVDSPGTYVVTVTGANGCTKTASASVLQDIAPPSVSVGPDRTLTCAEPSIFVNAVICGGCAPFTFEWTDDCGAVISTSKDMAIQLPGTYTLTVTGANGCSSSDSLQVSDGVSPPIVDAGPDQTLACVGDQVLLDATVTGGTCPYQYVWVNACNEIVGQCEDIVVSLPGVYILTVRTADGCVGVDSVTVESP